MNKATLSPEIADLLKLGQARRPWEFVRAVAQSDQDTACLAPVRFLLAANLGSLGFGDAAIEILDELKGSGTGGLDTGSLRAALSKLPATAVTPQTQISNRKENRLLGPEAPAPERIWRTGSGHALWAESDRLVGCPAAEHARTVLDRIGLSTDRSPREHLPPLLIAGLATPMLLDAALRATRPLANGYAPRVIVVEPDATRASRALAMMSLAESLDEHDTLERVVVLTGETALDQLECVLIAGLESALPSCVLCDAEADPALGSAVESCLLRAKTEQEEQIDAELLRIERSTQTADRCVSRIIGENSLRVLLVASRHTTFVRHSAFDMASALQSLGHRAELLTEPDAHSTHSRLAYLRAYADADPDLVILVNHPRWRLGGALPGRAPSVCWVQDAMPHLFEEARDRQGEHDFLVGYRFPETVERFGFRADRVIDAPLPVNREKFHDAPVSPSLRDRLTCDVAFATRQSETPEAMVERLVSQAGADSPNGALVRCVWDLVRSRFEDGESFMNAAEMEGLAKDAIGASGSVDPDPRTVDRTVRLLVLPLIDRVIRHRVVAWAAEICEEHGWSLALYGSGWDQHPTLSRYARGELLHGEELRSAYRGAGVHLNASAHSLIHQRVVECLLSGGRMLCYRRRVDVLERRWRLLADLARNTAPDAHEPDGSALYHAKSHAAVEEHLARWERLGMEEVQRRGDSIRIDARFFEHFRGLDCGWVDPELYGLGTAMIDQASFASRDELETRLTRAMEQRTAFDADLDPVRSVAGELYDVRGVIKRVLQAVATALRAEASR